MNRTISRREFLKICAAGAALPLPRAGFGIDTNATTLVRVARSWIDVFQAPDYKSEKVGRKYRDELISVYYHLDDDDQSPDWYRIWGGYIHAAYVQSVTVRMNPVAAQIPTTGQPSQVTVPFTTALRFLKNGQWEPIYRLYHGSNHWIRNIVSGPDGNAWYQIVDSYDREYFAPAEHFHLFTQDEIAPLSSQLSSVDKRIEVSISQQKVWAYEGNNLVLQTAVSTGRRQVEQLGPGDIPTDTPIGDFHIMVKTFCRHMGDTMMTPDIEYHAYPGVPFVSFFHEDGYSFHGTFWHQNFGTRLSSGCVNMTNADALWLFRWCEPYTTLEERQVTGWGTLVSIRE